jgi:hypothetical protein
MLQSDHIPTIETKRLRLRGWPPLCEVLGLPIPAEPFPRANSREAFIARRNGPE